MAISTLNSKLFYKSGAYWIQFTGVREVSTPKSKADKLEITDLDSEQKNYIPGLPDADDVSFKILHTEAVFTLLDTLHNVVTDFKVTFSDDTGFEFTGFVSEYSCKPAPNAVVEWDVTISGVTDVAQL